jgi:hypothetical protein
MTPEQQAALESVCGRALTPDDISAIDPLLPDRNDVQIAALLTASQPDMRQSLRVEDVFEILYTCGDYATLKTAQLSGNAIAVMAFSILHDAKTIGHGLVNLDAPQTAALCDELQAATLLSQAGRDALEAHSKVRPMPIQYNAVSDALNVAEGRLTLAGQ